MQNPFKKVVFADPPLINIIPSNPKEPPFYNLYKLPSPQTSPPHQINDMINSNASPRVNVPNNSIKFYSIKDYEAKNNILEMSTINSKPTNGNLESLANQSLMSQINDNITNYKSEKFGQMEAEISNLLKVIKEKQEEINILRGDITALTIALKEKDMLTRDSKQLANSLNTILLENQRLNEMTKEKIEEIARNRETIEKIIRENEILRRKNE